MGDVQGKCLLYYGSGSQPPIIFDVVEVGLFSDFSFCLFFILLMVVGVPGFALEDQELLHKIPNVSRQGFKDGVLLGPSGARGYLSHAVVFRITHWF